MKGRRSVVGKRKGDGSREMRRREKGQHVLFREVRSSGSEMGIRTIGSLNASLSPALNRKSYLFCAAKISFYLPYIFADLRRFSS